MKPHWQLLNSDEEEYERTTVVEGGGEKRRERGKERTHIDTDSASVDSDDASVADSSDEARLQANNQWPIVKIIGEKQVWNKSSGQLITRYRVVWKKDRTGKQSTGWARDYEPDKNSEIWKEYEGVRQAKYDEKHAGKPKKDEQKDKIDKKFEELVAAARESKPKGWKMDSKTWTKLYEKAEKEIILSSTRRSTRRSGR